MDLFDDNGFLTATGQTLGHELYEVMREHVKRLTTVVDIRTYHQLVHGAVVDATCAEILDRRANDNGDRKQ